MKWCLVKQKENGTFLMIDEDLIEEILVNREIPHDDWDKAKTFVTGELSSFYSAYKIVEDCIDSWMKDMSEQMQSAEDNKAEERFQNMRDGWRR